MRKKMALLTSATQTQPTNTSVKAKTPDTVTTDKLRFVRCSEVDGYIFFVRFTAEGWHLSKHDLTEPVLEWLNTKLKAEAHI
jgi:hypothetical protein